MTEDTIARVRAALARLAEVGRALTGSRWSAMGVGYASPSFVPLAPGDPVPVVFADGDNTGDVLYAATAWGQDEARRNVAAIVALRNAAPALLALAEVAARAVRWLPYHEPTHPDYPGEIADAGREWRAALAALADATGEVG